jgi:hypothetical protein
MLDRMGDGAGVAMIVAGAAGLLVVAFGLRRMLASAVVFGLLAVLWVLVGAGALVVQSSTTTADWIVTLAAVATLGPLHLRFLLGPFGPAAGPTTAATEAV